MDCTRSGSCEPQVYRPTSFFKLANIAIERAKDKGKDQVRCPEWEACDPSGEECPHSKLHKFLGEVFGCAEGMFCRPVGVRCVEVIDDPD